MVEEIASTLGAETTVASRTPPGGDSPAPPKQLGSIRLIRPIGKGGMAEVWLGRHEILGRNVAVKILSTTVMHQGDPSWKEFIEGASVAAARAHPGLNKVFHADVAEGMPYLVLEYLDGPNLHELLARSGRLDLAAARAIIESVCGAVAELHQHDLVHRDLKPSNIMLTTDGQVIVTDFGLARAGPAGALRANSGGVAGTPTYMAPEMFDGVVSARTDVYAIGMTAYQLLCGRPAFSATFDELKQQHQTAEIDLEPLRAAGVPARVIEVIIRATSKDVLFRPKSARHVLDAFRTAFDTAGVRCASPQELTTLLTRRSLAALQTTPAVVAASGVWHDRLAALAGRRRDRRPQPEPTPAIFRRSASPSDSDDLLHRRKERRRVRIASAAASLVGALTGSLILMYAGRLVSRWDQWVNEDLAHSPIVRSTTGAVTTVSRVTPLWASLLINIPPLLILTIACVGVTLLCYWLLRGRRLPQAGDRTRCGWCEHELRGISIPACSECGHRIGDRGPDDRGELPVGRQWAYRLRGLLLCLAIFFLAWAAIAVSGALILSLIIPGASMKGPALFFVTFFIALVITVQSYEAAAQYWLSHSGRAWCRKCKVELRDLSEPICPACGERI
jgi:serine/threonine protein kinase